jgi:hypothetical protein
MSLPNIPDGGYDPADISDDDEVELDDEYSESDYVEDSGWDESTERHWFPGPK